jgi:hypothetical protein
MIDGISAYRKELAKKTDKNKRPIVNLPRDGGLYFIAGPLKANNIAFVEWLHPFLTARHHWMLSKAALVAEMYADWLLDRDVALRYWPEVLEESNPDVDHETREISRKLTRMAKGPKRVHR